MHVCILVCVCVCRDRLRAQWVSSGAFSDVQEHPTLPALLDSVMLQFQSELIGSSSTVGVFQESASAATHYSARAVLGMLVRESPRTATQQVLTPLLGVFVKSPVLELSPYHQELCATPTGHFVHWHEAKARVMNASEIKQVEAKAAQAKLKQKPKGGAGKARAGKPAKARVDPGA
jgi:hypothetical protein